jgi:Fe-S-cluster formation regulator IscX/YfhJ
MASIYDRLDGINSEISAIDDELEKAIERLEALDPEQIDTTELHDIIYDLKEIKEKLY